MISKSGYRFSERSCSNNKLERDDDSKKSHPALARRRFGGRGAQAPRIPPRTASISTSVAAANRYPEIGMGGR